MAYSDDITLQLAAIQNQNLNYLDQLKPILQNVADGLGALGETDAEDVIEAAINGIGNMQIVKADWIKPQFEAVADAFDNIGGDTATDAAVDIRAALQSLPDGNDVWFDQVKPIFEIIVTVLADEGQ